MQLPVRLLPKLNSLHTRLMLTLSIIITLTITGVAYLQTEQERNSSFRELEKHADRLVNLVSQSIAYSVWNVDLIAIDEQLEALSSDPEIAQCTVTAEGYGILQEITLSQEPLNNPIIRKKDINFSTDETGSQKIGEVKIVLTSALVDQKISEDHRENLLMIMLILAVMYAATFVLLRRVVSLPVNHLEIMVDRISHGDLEARCTTGSDDELGRLGRRINTMADSLLESHMNLQNSEQRLQNVLEGSQLGYWDWNIETGEVIRNERWAEMLGYTLKEVEDSVSQWTDLHHPDDRARTWKSITDHLEGRTSAHDMEYRMQTKSGQYIWILDQAKIVSRDAQGRPLRMCGTHRDITERKKTERELMKLSTAVQQSPAVIVVTDTEGRTEYVNPKFTELTGFSFSEAIGQKSNILKSGKQSGVIFETLWQTIQSGNVWRGEFYNTKKNGELYWERASISPVRNRYGEVINYIKISEDISEIKNKEQELKLALEKAKESDRLKSAFLANMSHEIRTPMNGILGFTNFLKDPRLSDEEKDQYIKIIEISGARMLTTLNDIIDISRLEAGLIKVVKSEVSVNEVLQEQYNFFTKEAESKGLELIYKQSLTDSDSQIITDRHKLEGILTNLIKNAIKFTNEGSITFGCIKKEIKSDILEFYVKDSGIGISADKTEAVFNRFEQAEIDYARAYQGSGLGLSICKSYVEMLGGNISVTSEEETGTTFLFQIPYIKQFDHEKNSEHYTEYEKH